MASCGFIDPLAFLSQPATVNIDSYALAIADKFTFAHSFLGTKPRGQRPIKAPQAQSISVVAGVLPDRSAAGDTYDPELYGLFRCSLIHRVNLSQRIHQSVPREC